MKHTVTEHTVAGGGQGLVVHVPDVDVVNLQIRFNSGYQFADRQHYEVPHVMEHLLASVTKGHPGPNEWNIEVQKNGAYVNASTSIDVNGYIFEFADFELERILGLVEEQITAPLFAPEALAAELGNVREELSRNTTQHATVCTVKLGEATFPKQWMYYDERIAQLEGIAVNDVEGHYHDTHTAANARFFIAGHFPDKGEAVVKRLDDIFAKLPAGKRLERNGGMGLDLPEPVVTSREIQQLYYRLSLFFGELTEPERRALTLLRLLFVGSMGSRVMGEARRRGLAYHVAAPGHAEPGNSSFGFAGYVTPKNADELFALIAREFSAVRDGGVTKAELQAAKDLLIGSVKRSTQTAGDILGWYMEPYDEAGEIRDFERTLESLHEVTPADVVAVARKAIGEQRKGLSLLGPVEGEQAQHYQQVLQPIWRS
jgi:predicted Zn-dependent peptidase